MSEVPAILFSFRCLRRRLIRLHDLRELRAKSANHGEFFTAKCPTSGANVDELNYGGDVVDVDGWEGCIGHGSIIWIQVRRDAETMPRLGQLDLRSALGWLSPLPTEWHPREDSGFDFLRLLHLQHQTELPFELREQ